MRTSDSKLRWLAAAAAATVTAVIVAPAMAAIDLVAPGGGVDAISTDYVAAAEKLVDLSVDVTEPSAPYDRDAFAHWSDLDGDGVDTRNEVLARDMSDVVWGDVDGDRVVLSGTLLDPYTGTTIDFVRGVTTSGAVQVDHIIPLSYAWTTGGADDWSDAKREQFANDPINLLAVDGPTNGSKGDQGPSEWLPQESFKCAYAVEWVEVASDYGVTLAVADAAGLADILGDCMTADGSGEDVIIGDDDMDPSIVVGESGSVRLWPEGSWYEQHDGAWTHVNTVEVVAGEAALYTDRDGSPELLDTFSELGIVTYELDGPPPGESWSYWLDLGGATTSKYTLVNEGTVISGLVDVSREADTDEAWTVPLSFTVESGTARLVVDYGIVGDEYQVVLFEPGDHSYELVGPPRGETWTYQMVQLDGSYVPVAVLSNVAAEEGSFDVADAPIVDVPGWPADGFVADTADLWGEEFSVVTPSSADLFFTTTGDLGDRVLVYSGYPEGDNDIFLMGPDPGGEVWYFLAGSDGSWRTDVVRLANTFTPDETVDEGDLTPNSVPELYGADGVAFPAGYPFDPMEGVVAYDADDGDLTGSIVVDGTVDVDVPGEYELVYSVTDAAGVTTEVTRLVTVEPAPNDDPLLAGVGDVSIPVGFDFDPLAGVEASDAEDGVLTGDVVVTGDVDVSTPGTYELVYSVTDSAGATTEVTRAVTVEAPPNSDPILIGVEDVSVIVNGDGFDPLAGVFAVDPDDGSSLNDAITVDGEVDTNVLGEYVLTYTVVDGDGVSVSVERVVTVVPLPNQVPVIDGAPDTLIVQGDEFDLLDGVLAIDTEDGDITWKIEVNAGEFDRDEVGSYQVAYTVTDSGGLSTTLVRQVTVIAGEGDGDEPNRIPAILGADDVSVVVGSEFDPAAGVTATDVEDGDLTDALVVDAGDLDVEKVGVYQVMYEVRDSEGAVATVIRLVTVIDEVPAPADPDDPDGSASPAVPSPSPSAGESNGSVLEDTGVQVALWAGLVAAFLAAGAGIWLRVRARGASE